MSKEELIRGLNDDLAAEWGTIIRYTYQAGKAFGLRGRNYEKSCSVRCRMRSVMRRFSRT